MNIVNGFEYYPMPVGVSDPARYKFVRAATLNANAPWESGQQSSIILDKNTPIRGAWEFAYRPIQPKLATNVQPPYSVVTKEIPWSYIYHVTLNDNRDGWVDPASITSDIVTAPTQNSGDDTRTDEPQTDPTKPENLVTLGLIGAGIWVLYRLFKGHRK
jgi:hypothetical protein